MKITSWVSVAVVCAAVAGAGGQNPTPAPPPREKPADEAWLPKPGSDPGVKGAIKIKDLASDPPTMFPDIGIPKAEAWSQEKYEAAFEQLCPRLRGKIVLTIEANDDPYRKLLKARLHQAVFEFQQRRYYGPIAGAPQDYKATRECLLDMQSAVTELWAGQPKELIPWLEELLVASKEDESFTRVRAFTGTIPPPDLYAARRLRLKMEAELRKAKNPK